MKKIPPKTDTDFRIAFAQSWNLAVAIVAPIYNLDSDICKPILEGWQKYFYDKLVTEPLEEDLKSNINKLNSDRPDKKSKHTLDFVEDLEQPE